VANYYNADGKAILEEGVAPTEVVHSAVAANDDADGGEDSAASAASQKEPPLGPRPLSSEDPVLRKALELLKNPAPVKKAA
jgi:C-terminal processing protease CtpA/Prc